MKRLLPFAIFLAILLPQVPAHAASYANGTVLKASASALYLYSSEGFGRRYVFPDAKTYSSWYPDFSQVKTISDPDLASIQLVGNVTYRPGKFLVKVNTDPKVYAVDSNGVLRWIKTEAIANALYGSAWATVVRDIPDAFFTNYEIGTPISSTSDYHPASVLAANPVFTVNATPILPSPPSMIGGVPDYGNPYGSCTLPDAAKSEDVSHPTTVVGTGTPESCTASAFESAVQKGGAITFNCGPSPVTITLTHQIKLLNKVGPKQNGDRVIDGRGLVTLSGGGTNRILYQDACEEALGWLNDHCNNSQSPRLVVQNLTFINGKASDAKIGGAAIYSNGGSLKVVNSKFYNNHIISSGPDVAGGAIYQTQGYGTTYITNSTFGGSADHANVGSNGGALGGLFASFTILNSVLSYNQAIGSGMNPAQNGTPGGGSGGAIYNDGNSFTLSICGSDISHNSSKELGGAIFYVANDVQGHIKIDQSTFKENASGSPWGPDPGVAKPGCYLQTTPANISITNTTF